MDKPSPVATYVAIAVAVAGFVLIAAAWDGASERNFVPAQFPYLLSGGLVGLGLIVVGFSFLTGLVFGVLRIANPDAAPEGVTTILLAVLFIGGIQLLSISIIGSYLAHMYDEVKARPTYIVEEILNPPGAGSQGVAGRSGAATGTSRFAYVPTVRITSGASRRISR